MIPFLKTVSLQLFIITTQAQAGFFFCESKLSKEYEIPKENAKVLCDSTFSNSIKKSIKQESKDDMKRLLSLLLAGNSYSITYDDAMKKAKSASNLEVQLISIYTKKQGLQNSINMFSGMNEDKQKAMLDIANKISMPGTTGNDFLKKASVSQLYALPVFLEDYDFEETTKLILAMTPEKLEIAKGLFPYFNNAPHRKGATPSSFLKLVNLANKKTVLCYSKLGRCELCAKELCRSKASIFSTFVENLPTDYSYATNDILELLIKHNHYTKNHSQVFAKLIPVLIENKDQETVKVLLTRAVINDNVTQQILKELESPIPDLLMIKKLMNSSTGIFITGPSIDVSRQAAAGRGHGSGSACNTSSGSSAGYRAKEEAIRQCESLYSSKKSLECETRIITYNGNDM